MPEKAFQDCYPEPLSHCYGCGSRNPAGHRLKSYWQGDLAVARFTPGAEHTAIPGFVYGGLLASLVDCHATGTAAAATARAQGEELGEGVLPRFVTASLKVDYLSPTPMGTELELRAKALEIKARKVVVAVTVHAGTQLCARAQVVAVRMPESMLPRGAIAGSATSR